LQDHVNKPKILLSLPPPHIIPRLTRKWTQNK
jgi:hypothetical protein